MPKKRRRKNSLRVAPFLWIGLVLNLVLGVLFSRMTVIRYGRIDGAPDWDQPRLTAILVGLKGIPCYQIPIAKVESFVLLNPEVRSARLTCNPFGGALLSVGYRTPVARVSSKPDWALAIDGMVYRTPHMPNNLPIVDLGQIDSKPLFTIAGATPTAAMAEVVVRAKEIFPGDNIKVELSPGSIVCLNVGAGRVILGSCDDLDAKLQVLSDRIAAEPRYFDRVDTLNVTVASTPTELPRKPGVPSVGKNK